MEYKQVIIVNKGLDMTPGKLAVQVAHASNMVFIHSKVTPEIQKNWIEKSYAKVVLKAKNENKLLKIIDEAKSMGLVEGDDFWRIIDEGRTEFNNNLTFTSISFKPMAPELIDKLTRKLQLYK